MTFFINLISKTTRNILWRTGLGRQIAARYWNNKQNGDGFKFIHQQKQDIFSELPTKFCNEIYSEFIEKDSKQWTLQENFIVEVGDVLLEPERLLGTRHGRQLVEQTVVYKVDRQFPYILTHLLRPAETTKLEVAVWYDGSATRNYYHHLVDALIDLQQLEKSGLPMDTPLLITRKMYDTVYFQYLYQRSLEMQSMNWFVVGDKEWVQVIKLYVFQTAPFNVSAWRTMRRMYALPECKPWRKVFLNRDKNRYGRYLKNEDTVVNMLKKLGFEEVFAENLTISQQVKLFQETEYLVALTGAGLIQQFFMTYDSGHVIEIMPQNRLMPEYYWQAYTLGMKYYDVVVGGDMRDGKAYPVDVTVLKSAVQRMLNNKHPGRVYGLTELPAASAIC